MCLVEICCEKIFVLVRSNKVNWEVRIHIVQSTIMDISEEDILSFSKLVKDINSQSGEMSNFVKNLQINFDDGQFNGTEKGISLLEVKNNLMLNYLIDLTHLLLKKVDKKSINNEPSVERLAETRVVLERLRPIEQKLKYQIDKLIKLVTTGNLSDADPLRFKPQLENFENESNNNSESESDEEDKKKSSKYVPPKLMAMPYDEDNRETRKLERAKKRALSSSLIQDLRDQYSQGPEEIHESRDYWRKKLLDEQKQRTEYEEDNLMRLQLTKKQKRNERRIAVDSTLNSLLSFGDYNVEEKSSFTRKKSSKHDNKKQKDAKKRKWKKRK